MKNILGFIGVALIILAAISTPLAIGLGLYEWVIADVEFKFALWYGFKVWIGMVLCLIPGFILVTIAQG